MQPRVDLIESLLEQPEQFWEAGSSYDLLTQFFHGLPIDRLRPLLKNDNHTIRKVGVFVASELGGQACSLLPEIEALAEDSSRYIQYHALEVIMVCSRNGERKSFSRIVRALRSADDVIRRLAMGFVATASIEQLQAALADIASEPIPDPQHLWGLKMLIKGSEKHPRELESVPSLGSSLEDLYVAVAVARWRDELPAIWQSLKAVENSDIRVFVERLSRL